MSSLGATSISLKGSEYFLNNEEKAADNSSTRLVTLQKGLSTTLYDIKEERDSLVEAHKRRVHWLLDLVLTQERSYTTCSWLDLP